MWVRRVLLVCLLASLVLSMNSSTADGGRALYSISRVGMTIKELGVLNRFHVPARAMTVDLVVNVCLVLFVSSNLAILYMSNIGYVFAHVAATSGFLLLRKDRPNWPRPIKVAPIWLPIAAIILLSNAVFLVVGAASPKLTGYDVDRLRDRRRHPRRLGPALHLPARRSGPPAGPPPRGDAEDAR